jgi:hypothetical protein
MDVHIMIMHTHIYTSYNMCVSTHIPTYMHTCMHAYTHTHTTHTQHTHNTHTHSRRWFFRTCETDEATVGANPDATRQKTQPVSNTSTAPVTLSFSCP